MKAIVLVSAVPVLIAPPLRAQSRTVAERLGYPRDAKLLILHADDLGAAHSINAACCVTGGSERRSWPRCRARPG